MHFAKLPPSDHAAFSFIGPDDIERAWNITRAQELVNDGREASPISLQAFGITAGRITELRPDLNVKRALTTNASLPILLIPFFGSSLIIDGWHRLYRAAVLGCSEVRGHFLSAEEAKCLMWIEWPRGAQDA